MKRKFASPKKAITDIIRSAFVRVSNFTLRPAPPKSIRETIATITARGLGDCITLTDLPLVAHLCKRSVHVWAYSPHFLPVMKFHPFYHPTEAECGIVNPFLTDVLRLNECFDLGNGHQIQRIRRAWGFPVDLRPQGCLIKQAEKIKNRVILHFEPSLRNVSWQRTHWHSKMREFYPESKAELEKFIRSRHDLSFVEVGTHSSEIAGVEFIPTGTTEDLIKLIQTGSWFVGIMSGPLHVAVASGLKCIVVVNYPKATQIVLPTLKWTGIPESEWLYPQNVHLHQEDESVLVPKISNNSLQAAFSGDVYPFWEDTWLGLINEL